MISSISDLKTDMLNIALYSETVNCMSRRLYKKILYFLYGLFDYFMYMYVSEKYITY